VNKQVLRAFLKSNGDPQAAQRALAKRTTSQTDNEESKSQTSKTTTERERLARTERERERQREREMIQTNGGAALSLFGETQTQSLTQTTAFDRRHAVSAAAGDDVCVSVCLSARARALSPPPLCLRCSQDTAWFWGCFSDLLGSSRT